MNLMMNMSFTNEIANERRQALIEAAERHRMRRWLKTGRKARLVDTAPTARRVLPIAAAITATAAHAASPATLAPNPVPATATATRELEHACARVG